MKLVIRQFENSDGPAVIELWRKCDLVRPQNNPANDIKRKMKINPELFLVGVADNRIIATVMGGYEGHRGWVNYLAVRPQYRRKGYGRQIMYMIEKKLLAVGCPKINLQVRSSNAAVIKFYERIGFKKDDVVSLGKRLEPDD